MFAKVMEMIFPFALPILASCSSKGYALLSDVTQGKLVVNYRRFGTSCRSHSIRVNMGSILECEASLLRMDSFDFNPLNPELNPICYLLALLGAHHFLYVSRIRVKLLTFRLLMSYIYIWSTHS